VAEPTRLLELEDVEARYGPVEALRGVTLSVAEGEVVAVLGANGAGKTTTLRAISGTVRRGGRIAFAGRSISRSSPEAVARLGIAHVPEGRGTLTDLSVRENLRLGAYVRRDRKGIREDERRVLGHFPWLERRGDQRAGTLSGGEQQMLALARALMLRPKLLLLDEPSLGLAPLVVSEIFRIVRELNEQDGLAVLVVEQNAVLALEASSRAYVLEVGRVAVAGESDELRRHESVRRSYLGY
jgi:branched-chain amino acid transport system ATP-binding protein